MSSTECRSLPDSGIEIREERNALIATGHAAITGSAYSMGSSDELLQPGCFRDTLGANPDVVFWWNHGNAGERPLARTKSGTLTLNEDAVGLWYRAELDPHDADAAQLIRSIKRGDIDGASFAFRCRSDSHSKSNGRSLRTIQRLDLNLGDVSPVARPANGSAYITARSRGGLTAGPDHLQRAREELVLLEARQSGWEPRRTVDVRGMTTEDYRAIVRRLEVGNS